MLLATSNWPLAKNGCAHLIQTLVEALLARSQKPTAFLNHDF
jgi:hypothetical protein